MSTVVAVMGFRRKHLLSEFQKNGATSKEKAVTVQEIYDNWDIKGFRPLRMRAIRLDTDFLCGKGKLIRTEEGKFYFYASK